MKKIFRRKHTVFVFSTVSAMIFLLSAVLSVLFAVNQDYPYLLFLFIPAILGVLFAMIAVIEHRGSVELDDKGIQFRYRIFSQSRELNRSGVYFSYSKIDHIQKVYIPGDGIVSKDATLYRFFLTDHQQADVYFFHFGKDGESEIVSILSGKVPIR